MEKIMRKIGRREVGIYIGGNGDLVPKIIVGPTTAIPYSSDNIEKMRRFLYEK